MVNYQAYLQFLRENIDCLVSYHSYAGTLTDKMIALRDDLFDDDPFKLYDASLQVSDLFSSQSLH